MNINTQTIEQFIVIRDGEIDEDYYRAVARRERFEQVRQAGAAILTATTRKAGRGLLYMYAGMYDAINEDQTDARAELREIWNW